MSLYRFSTVERLSLWEAYGRRCAYSGEPLSYADLNIDHVLPERLLQSPDELKQVCDRYGLGADFSINSYLNWIPVHARFNRQKGSRVYDEPAAHYFLDLARSRYDTVRKLADQLRRKLESDDILLPLGAAIEAGVLTSGEALDYIGRLSEDERFSLLRPLRFEDKEVQGAISWEEGEALRNTTVRHGSPEEGVLLVNQAGAELRVRSCADLASARMNGFYAPTTYAMKMESFLNETCGVLDALAHAKIASTSYLRDPRVGIVDLDLLPASVLRATSLGEDTPYRASQESISIQDLVDAGDVRVKRVSQYSIQLEHQEEQLLRELLRADFNHDGIEDLLVFSYSSAIMGSFGYGDVFMLTRTGPTELFSLLERVPP